MRQVSPRMAQYLLASNAQDVLATLIQIHHSAFAKDLFYVNKKSYVRSPSIDPSTGDVVTGTLYRPRGFSVPLPSELINTLPQMSLRIDNSDLQPGYALLGTANGVKPDVYLSCILLSDPTTIQFGPCFFKGGPISGNSSYIEITLMNEDGLNEMFPTPGMTPSFYPALFPTNN